MKTVLSSKRYHYVARASIFFITAALIAGMVGCGPTPVQYDLTISSSAGGSVTTPSEGVFPYDEGTVLDLVAEADACYGFINWTGDVDTIADVYAAITNITMDAAKNVTANFAVLSYNLTADSTDGGSVTDPGEGTFTYDCGDVVNLVATPGAGFPPMVAAGYFHTVGLKTDGTVVAVGRNYDGQCNVGGWTDITQVAAGVDHTVGLESDGTVVAVGDNNDGQLDVGGWTDIVQVAAGCWHTVGLKTDGTVVAVGFDSFGQCTYVGGWTDIVQVAAGVDHTVGLKSDGTVVAVGDNSDGQCDVGGWTGIVQVAADWEHTVGLKTNAAVVAVGDNNCGQCNVGGWTDITQVAAGFDHTVGLESDGRVVAVGWNDDGQCNVGSWTLFAHTFVNWTGDVGTIADVNAAATNITINGDYSITANFGPV